MGFDVITAPGYTVETFTASVERAKGSQLRIWPSERPGVVMVSSSRGPAVYAVTRHSCDCMAGAHGRVCQHRAWACHCADVWGIDLCNDTVIGSDLQGCPVTERERAAQLQEVA